MRILITAGPTREYLDTVRFLSNASSGKMGYAIAAEARERGHDVVLVSGPVDRPVPAGVELVQVVSAEQMLAAALSAFDDCAAAVMAAAVCDFRPAQQHDHKLPKASHSRSLELVRNPDICAILGQHKAGRVVVGFAMEDRDHHARAAQKLREKHCNAIVMNAVEAAGVDEARIEILRVDAGWLPAASGVKATLARVVVELVETLVAAG